MLMKRILLLCLLLLSTLTAAGCATDEKKKAATQLQDRRKQYAELQKALQDSTIKKGTKTSTIRNLFGEPDDKYDAGSSMSSVAVWTYRSVPNADKSSAEFKPITLYFNDDKLVEWRL